MNETPLVECEVEGTTLRATDVADSTVAIDLTGWDALSADPVFDDPVDATIAGRASQFRCSLQNYFGVDRLDGAVPVSTADPGSDFHDLLFEPDSDRDVSLPAGRYNCRFGDCLRVQVRFDGAASVTNHAGGRVTVSFPHPTRLTFGFRTTENYPQHALTVDPTPEGFASALSHLGAAARTTTAYRSSQEYRDYPPLIELGPDRAIPEAVRDRTPDTGIELVVPPEWEPLFPAAPLAYYFGARVRLDDVAAPVIRAPAVDLVHEFSPLPAFQSEARNLLRRACLLDTIAMWAGPDGVALSEPERLQEAGVDVGVRPESPIAERLAAYLDLPADPVDDVLPDWPHRATVPPTAEHVPVVPHLVADLAAIGLPADDADGTSTGTCERTGEAERGGDRPSGTDVRTERVRDDGLEAAKRVHGVFGARATGTAFTALPAAYENRLAYLGRATGAVNVAVVFGGGGSEASRRRVVERYGRRADRFSVTVDRVDDPTTDELAGLLGREIDFLHFVGDCDGSGLVCADGVLEPAALEANNTQLFQLDAPDSYEVGVGLVERGSVAGVACRSASSTDDHRIGTTIGELLLYGQSIASARTVGVVCGEIGAESDVVGDGTHRFVAKWAPAGVEELTSGEDGGIRVTVRNFPVDPPSIYSADTEAESHLTLTNGTSRVDPADLTSFFSTGSTPRYYDGRLYWPEEVMELVNPVS